MDQDKDKESKDQPKEHKPPKGDWFLRQLVLLANTLDGTEFQVTLAVGGAIISGKISSGKGFFQAFGQSLGEAYTSAAGEEAGKLIREGFQTPGKLYDTPENLNADTTEFIHLRDARYFHAGVSPMPVEGAWWRGRIQNIDGFSLGEFVATPNK